MAYDAGLAERIRSILSGAAEFSEKKMFGGLAFMIDGQMRCGVLKTDLVLRLTPESVAEALHQPHTRPMDFTGKPMKSMIYISAAGTDSDQALEDWVMGAVRLARSASAGDAIQSGAVHRASTASAARRSAISKSASKRMARKRG